MSTIEDNLFSWLQQALPEPTFSYSVGKRRAYLEGEIAGKYKQIEIYLIGGNDAQAQKKVRGATIFFAYCDELSLYPYSFWLMLLRGLSVKGASLYGTTNPDNPRHWLKQVIDSEEIDKNYFHFIFYFFNFFIIFINLFFYIRSIYFI